MSRMKREVPLHYSGPEGVIYAVYFKYNENIDAGAPLIGVCPQDQLPAIQDVIMRVRTVTPASPTCGSEAAVVEDTPSS